MNGLEMLELLDALVAIAHAPAHTPIPGQGWMITQVRRSGDDYLFDTIPVIYFLDGEPHVTNDGHLVSAAHPSVGHVLWHPDETFDGNPRTRAQAEHEAAQDQRNIDRAKKTP